MIKSQYITCSEREGRMLDNLPKNFNQFLNILICLRGIIEPLEHADFFDWGLILLYVEES